MHLSACTLHNVIWCNSLVLKLSGAAIHKFPICFLVFLCSDSFSSPTSALNTTNFTRWELWGGVFENDSNGHTNRTRTSNHSGLRSWKIAARQAASTEAPTLYSASKFYKTMAYISLCCSSRCSHQVAICTEYGAEDTGIQSSSSWRSWRIRFPISLIAPNKVLLLSRVSFSRRNLIS